VKEIIETLSHHSAEIPEFKMTIEPEAAIVNYCMVKSLLHMSFPSLSISQPGSFMGGHVDDAELTHDHPVVSMSLGRPCAFIVGQFPPSFLAFLTRIRRSD
jgi:hypothetical protein